MRARMQHDTGNDTPTEPAAATAPEMRVWLLRPVDPNAEPFYFSNVAKRLVVAAPTEAVARRIAAHEPGGASWADAAAAACEPISAERPGVLARDFGA